MIRRLFLIAAACLLAALPAAADDLAAAKEPGAIVIMRHALAPGTGDPTTVVIGDCSTQRNLDDRGRDQARQIGAAFRERGIGFDRVLTSQWCRCRETAELLGLGAVEDLPAMNSFFRRFDRRESQTAELKGFIASLPADARVMLVTHQVNISALTGQGTSSGEALVLKRLDGGEVEVTGSILIRP
ncbi:MAG: histidine phosphatase family protein [Minwuia sp.]|uniref:histidine phosphatase family protein n=1 Tax=Minwuia sp. TaxID=2493630 RepID=UPI003A8B08F9